MHVLSRSTPRELPHIGLSAAAMPGLAAAVENEFMLRPIMLIAEPDRALVPDYARDDLEAAARERSLELGISPPGEADICRGARFHELPSIRERIPHESYQLLAPHVVTEDHAVRLDRGANG